MANPYNVTDSSNLESLFSNLNQVTMRESRGGGGKGGGSLPIEGNMDSNPLIAHNPYLGKNVTSFDDGGVVDTTESLPMDSLLNRQIYKESAFDAAAESGAGAVGLTQIMPDTFKFFQDKGWVPEGKKFSDLKTDTALATDLQQKYMNDLLSRDWNKGSEQVKRAKALAAYNMGPTKLVNKLNELKKKGVDIYNDLDWVNDLNTETSDYVNKILLGGDANFEADYTTEYNKTGKDYNEGGEFGYSVNPYKAPRYNQGGHYTQQANEAIAANQLSNILLNSASLSSSIMPMANKGMKMESISNKERLQNLLKAVPNEAAFNKLSKTDQENFTKSWIKFGGVKKRKFTQGGRF